MNCWDETGMLSWDWASPKATTEATPFTVLLCLSSCGPGQEQPYVVTAWSQQAAPPSQTLQLPNSSLLVSRVSPAGKRLHSTWIILCQERIRGYYLRSVNWSDTQRKLSVAGRVVPISRRLLHAVSTLGITLRTTAPLCRNWFVSEAVAFHKSLRSCSFFHSHIYSKEILGLEFPPLSSSSHKLGQVSARLDICWTCFPHH